MILDELGRAADYLALHPGFAAAFEYLRNSDVTKLPKGKHALDGDRLAVVINREVGRGRSGAKLEAHRRFIDIQVTLHGQEEIGWRSLSTCRDITVPYGVESDVMLFGDEPTAWIQVPPGQFAIFFPGDAHAPLASNDPLLHKAVFKIAVEW